MASEAESPVSGPSSNSRNIDFSIFLPFLLGFTNPNPVQDSSTGPFRVILINPVTRGMFVIEAGSDSLLTDLFSKDGQPPASKASIESLPSVEIGEEEGEEKSECAICLEEWGVGGLAKEMPCQHRFHKECIEKWLGIHGSCPVCRYQMPAEDDEGKQKIESGWRRGGIWVGFTVGDGRNVDNDQSVSNEIEP